MLYILHQDLSVNISLFSVYRLCTHRIMGEHWCFWLYLIGLIQLEIFFGFELLIVAFSLQWFATFVSSLFILHYLLGVKPMSLEKTRSFETSHYYMGQKVLCLKNRKLSTVYLISSYTKINTYTQWFTKERENWKECSMITNSSSILTLLNLALPGHTWREEGRFVHVNHLPSVVIMFWI